MIGSAVTIRSPSTTMRSRRTPCVAGCCGPMFRTMSAVARPPAPTPTVRAWRRVGAAVVPGASDAGAMCPSMPGRTEPARVGRHRRHRRHRRHPRPRRHRDPPGCAAGAAPPDDPHLPRGAAVGHSGLVTQSLDLSDEAFVADPYPTLAQLRTVAPIVRHEGLGLWLTTTHAAANDVLRDRRLGRIFRPRATSEDDPWTVFDWLHADSILDSEPPKHTRLRRLVAGAFNRGHIERLRPRVEEIAGELLTGLEARLDADGRVDVIESYAEPL